ncbi:TPA: shikimate dehydrogenase [Candidatus Bathyarchaeota archaeon]|nr:shikimate dehydrogenase [Candidatus Bathyarchaeota archaeon]
MTGKTGLCAVIGDPIEHSLSPSIHNAAFKHLGLDYVYVAFRVRPENLEWAINGVRVLGIKGINVTMPHKISVMKHLDNLDLSAEFVGAVNTIINNEGILVGYNTDGIGALKALEDTEGDLKSKKTLIIGAGGASRAVSFTLAPKVKELVIVNRTFKKAVDLAMEVKLRAGGNVRANRYLENTLKEELDDTDIIINATPIGMHPKERETPIPKTFLKSDMTIFDLVYNPLETRFLREAKAIGARIIDGLTMLVYQGAASFKLWMNVEPPINVMMKAARKELERRKLYL